MSLRGLARRIVERAGFAVHRGPANRFEAMDAAHVAATTLDGLLAGRVEPSDRALLKLDIEGHEIEALRGAAGPLGRVEVVSEVRFFDVNGSARPLFGDVLAFLEARAFALFDFASLGGRPRDQRLEVGDPIFIRRGGPLGEDIWSD